MNVIYQVILRVVTLSYLYCVCILQTHAGERLLKDSDSAKLEWLQFISEGRAAAVDFRNRHIFAIYIYIYIYVYIYICICFSRWMLIK